MTGRKIIFTTLLVLVGSVLTQCGLERSVTPWGPLTNGQAFGGLYSFDTSADHATNASRLFWGYEIYYCIRDDATFVACTQISDLEANGYKRMHIPADTITSSTSTVIAVPLVAQIGAAYNITLDFRTILASGHPYAFSTNNGALPSVELRRAVHYAGSDYGLDENHFKRFSEFTIGDNDITPQTVFDDKTEGEPGDPINISMAVYAYAYGKSSDLTQTITSELCYLGYSLITVNYNNGLP